MPTVAYLIEETFPMSRPRILVKTAKLGASRYNRKRDLPGAVPGLSALPEGEILPRLARAEARCEEDRRTRSAAYRPSRHVQILAALLAETASAHRSGIGTGAASRCAYDQPLS